MHVDLHTGGGHTSMTVSSQKTAFCHNLNASLVEKGISNPSAGTLTGLETGCNATMKTLAAVKPRRLNC